MGENSAGMTSLVHPFSHNSSIHGSPPPQPQPVCKESHFQLYYCRWNNPAPEWKEWVDVMYAKHQTLWKKAGILEAVLNSKYTIYRDEDLLHAFASKWCSETNTFVFPWGEATLTLEDMMMLGGYSVLGDPVFRPLEDTDKLIKLEEEHQRLELCKTKTTNKVVSSLSSPWLCKFMNSGNEIEHEAFLVYWLSRFVFPLDLDVDSRMKCVFRVAIHLANGTRMALAPAVLACIYSDLSAYKKTALLSSPFNLIQVWVWERFPLLQPKCENVKPEEPSFAKWHGLKRNGDGIVTDEAIDSFVWRPYGETIWERLLPSRIDEGKQQCLPVTFTSGTDEQVETLIKCLRVSELVGIDSECIQQYLPHRVARQFRLDQDIPAKVKRANSDQLLAWENYNRPVPNKRFCLPPHLYEPNVTVRYLEWWKKPMSAQDIELETLWELKKRKLMDSARQELVDKVLMDSLRKKPEDKVCDPAGTACNALKDCEALEDGTELKERVSRESARQEPVDEASRDKVLLENLESSKEPDIGGLKQSRFSGDIKTYKRRIKSSALKSVAAKKQDVDILVPPGNNGGARCLCAKNVDKESLCPQPTQPNVLSHANENEATSVPWLSKDSLFELEARIFRVEATLARYIKIEG